MHTARTPIDQHAVETRSLAIESKTLLLFLSSPWLAVVNKAYKTDLHEHHQRRSVLSNEHAVFCFAVVSSPSHLSSVLCFLLRNKVKRSQDSVDCERLKQIVELERLNDP